MGLVSGPAYAAGLPRGLKAALRPRWIGPPGISGRVTVLAVTESKPRTFFVGAAAGGVWRTTNGGATFQPVFDAQPTASIGALSLFQPDPQVVWAGTGECGVRNSVSSGNGVYRSVDGGETWTHLGLEKSERIARIALHPGDPDVALVAALGPLWGEGGERGVYR